MLKGKVIPSSLDHVLIISQNMREDDLIELEALGHNDPYIALNKSFDLTKRPWTATLEGEPIFMFGVVPISELTGLGSPWLLGTEGITKAKRQFIKECRIYMSMMLEEYPRLSNCVDCRNEVSIRWLKWLGFEFKEAVRIGVNGEWFYPFNMEKGNV